MVGLAIAAITLSLLGASGVAKVLDPNPTSGALRAAGLPSSNLLSRVLGVAEIAAGVLGLALGGTVLFAASALYLAFALFTLAAIRGRIPLQSCGCFGRDDTPPSVIHVAYNGVAAITLGWMAATGAAAFPWYLGWLEAALFALFAALGAYASFLLLARLPMTLQVARNP